MSQNNEYKKASISIMGNIAEGVESQSKFEFINFFIIQKRQLMR